MNPVDYPNKIKNISEYLHYSLVYIYIFQENPFTRTFSTEIEIIDVQLEFARLRRVIFLLHNDAKKNKNMCLWHVLSIQFFLIRCVSDFDSLN